MEEGPREETETVEVTVEATAAEEKEEEEDQRVEHLLLLHRRLPRPSPHRVWCLLCNPTPRQVDHESIHRDFKLGAQTPF